MSTAQPPVLSTHVSNLRIAGYALGEGAISITINGLSNFALLFYTQVLGLGAKYAGLALSVAVLLDAVADPVMGYITDGTRSRWGRRMPYIFAGGLLLSTSFLALWIVPPGLTTAGLLFAWALLVNICLRLSTTVFGIPYTALGFEICPSYEDRSRLQGIRAAMGMAVNLIFGAFAWTLFFSDGHTPDGARIDGTRIGENYIGMGITLSVVSFIMVAMCIFSTRFAATDNRKAPPRARGLRAFRNDLMGIVKDPLAWYVFGFFAVALFGVLLVSQAQMFVYVFFMELSAFAKTLIHGSGMVACGIAALLQAWLTKKTDKKTTGYIGMSIAMFGGLFLQVVFFGFGVSPQALWQAGDISIPAGIILFGIGQTCWWGGVGILGPLAMSMVADLSEINFTKTGVLKDGSYSAFFTFLQKAAMSLGLLLTGVLLSVAGIVSGAQEQSPEASRHIAMITFLLGPILIVISFLILKCYPVDRAYLHNLKSKNQHR